MLAKEILQNAYRHFAARTWGGNKYTPNVMQSEVANLITQSDDYTLPAVNMLPAQDLQVSGKYYAMADYSVVDGGVDLIR